LKPITSENNLLKSSTIQGIKWNLINKIVAQLFSLVFAIILARLLTPEEFGLVAMVTVVLGIIKVIYSFGLGEALVQKKEITENDLSSVFWVNILLGVFFAFLAIIAAPFISSFYGNSTLVTITYFFAFTFLIDSFTVVYYAFLWRHMDYRQMFFIQFPAIVISGILAVLMAMNGYGVWSLVTKALISAISILFFLTLATSWSPKFIFKLTAIKSLIGFSLPRVGTLSFSYLIRNLDKILIGHFLGSAPLGFYEKSYSFMLMPLSNITNVISQVLFPSFSKIQDNYTQIKWVFFKVIRCVALFTFPLMSSLSICSDSFILFLLGEKWAGAIPILRILAWVGLIQSVSGFYQPVYLSQGATKLQFKLDIFLKTQSVFWIVMGLKWGITGVAYGLLIGVIINQIPYLYFMGILINMSLVEFIKNLIPIIFINVIYFIVMLIINYFLLPNYAPSMKMLLFIIVGIAFYLGLCLLFRIKAFQEVYELAITSFKSRTGEKK